jgi:anaerobic selenocysteine-containing dehydrogenase
MLNVIISEGLYDHEFVHTWCSGFDELKKRAAEYPLDRVSSITWIPADDIAAAARMYATARPAAIHWGVPIDMAPSGTTVAQAISHLWSITGNIDVPGGQVVARAAFDVTTYPFSTQELHSLYGEAPKSSSCCATSGAGDSPTGRWSRCCPEIRTPSRPAGSRRRTCSEARRPIPGFIMKR